MSESPRKPTLRSNWITDIFKLIWRLLQGIVGAAVAGTMGMTIALLVVLITGPHWLYSQEADTAIKVLKGFGVVAGGTMLGMIAGWTWPKPFVAMFEWFERLKRRP